MYPQSHGFKSHFTPCCHMLLFGLFLPLLLGSPSPKNPKIHEQVDFSKRCVTQSARNLSFMFWAVKIALRSVKINSYRTNSLPFLNTHKLFEVANGAHKESFDSHLKIMAATHQERERENMNGQSGTYIQISMSTWINGWLQRKQEQKGEAGHTLMPVK